MKLPLSDFWWIPNVIFMHDGVKYRTDSYASNRAQVRNIETDKIMQIHDSVEVEIQAESLTELLKHLEDTLEKIKLNEAKVNALISELYIEIKLGITKEQRAPSALDLVVQLGDYVLATKYHDGDPKDGFAIGYVLNNVYPYRIQVRGSDGQQIGGSYRRYKKIDGEFGQWIVKNIARIEDGSKSLWDYLEKYEQALVTDSVNEHFWEVLA